MKIFLNKIIQYKESKKILVSFDSKVEGYSIIEKKERTYFSVLDTNNIKIKNLEKFIIKNIKNQLLEQKFDGNALIDLNLDFRLNKLYISGTKAIVKRLNDKKYKGYL